MNKTLIMATATTLALATACAPKADDSAADTNIIGKTQIVADKMTAELLQELGKVSELEFDTCQGKILSFTVSRECGFFSFGKAPCITIPWCKIECIGEDTLLVRIPCSELPESFKTENKEKM